MKKIVLPFLFLLSVTFVQSQPYRQKRQNYSYKPPYEINQRLNYFNLNYQDRRMIDTVNANLQVPQGERSEFMPDITTAPPQTYLDPRLEMGGPGWPRPVGNRPIPEIYSHQTDNNPVNLGEPGIQPPFETKNPTHFGFERQENKPNFNRILYRSNMGANNDYRQGPDTRFDSNAEAHIQPYNTLRVDYNAEQRKYTPLLG